MRGEGFDGQDIDYLLELLIRAKGGQREVGLAVDPGFFSDPGQVSELARRAGKQLAGAGENPGKGLMISTVSLVAQAGITHYQIQEQSLAPAAGSQDARKGSRQAYLQAGGPAQEVPVYDREKLLPGHELEGPALVESQETTALVPRDWKLWVDQYNHCILEKKAGQ